MMLIVNIISYIITVTQRNLDSSYWAIGGQGKSKVIVEKLLRSHLWSVSHSLCSLEWVPKQFSISWLVCETEIKIPVYLFHRGIRGIKWDHVDEIILKSISTYSCKRIIHILASQVVLAVTSKDSKHADACVQMIICDINKFSPDTYSFRCRSDLVSDCSQNFIETLRMIFFF